MERDAASSTLQSLHNLGIGRLKMLPKMQVDRVHSSVSVRSRRECFREYLSARINRNGATIAVTETGDFPAIIRRRIFEQAKFEKPAAEIAKSYQRAVDSDHAWEQQVLDRIGAGKRVATLAERVGETYPCD